MHKIAFIGIQIPVKTDRYIKRDDKADTGDGHYIEHHQYKSAYIQIICIGGRAHPGKTDDGRKGHQYDNGTA